ncbi:MAG: MBL fold metallo-hydrolase, partial [Deltaproteobacteria bacterium]|nr:MBL fold metallo-hydrolase [Deltaproteobacteria bacterium]
VISRRFNLPVFVTKPTLKAARDRMGRLFEVKHFQCGSTFRLGVLNIRPFPVSHDAADPVGFCIQADGMKIGIATDLGVATRLVCHHLRGCRLLVLEANHDLKMLEEGPYPWPLKQRIRGRRGHLSNEDSRDLLERVTSPELQHVVVAHLSEKNNHPERALSVLGRPASTGKPRFHLARQDRPGDMIVLDD